MPVQQILSSVYQVGMGYVNAFLIVEDGATLIDSGLPKKRDTLIRALGDVGLKAEALKHIAVTHHHADHAGSLAALARATGARTYVHPLDAEVVRGDRPQPGPNKQSMMGRFIGPIVARLPANRLEHAPVDHEVQDGETLPIAGGLKAVHTPGHTAGHLAFVLERDGGILFTGDAAAHMFGRLGKPFPMFTEDMGQAKQSMRKLAELNFDVACFGHGTVIKGKANAKFRRYVEKMAR